MAICNLDLNDQVIIIIITSMVKAINFRSSFNNINYHMDIGNFFSITYDPLLFLIKNIISILFLLAYFIELKINKKNNVFYNKKISNEKVEEEYTIATSDKSEDDLGVIESIVLTNKLYENIDKFCFVIKVFFSLIFIYIFEEIVFIAINNHVLDRLICSMRILFSFIGILVLSAILFHNKINKSQIKNFLIFKKHQIIPLIIICSLTVFLILYNSLKIARFKAYYNINFLYYIICCIFLGFDLTLTKYLLEKLYINKYLILGLKGVLGTIAFIIINVKVDKDEYYNFLDKIFSFQYTIKSEDFHILLKIIYVVSLIIFQYLKISLIDKFGEMHYLSSIMIANILYFPLYCIERFAIQGFAISTKDTFFINIIIYILITILMLIFNEILVLNFWGFNTNLRKNIIQRENQDKTKMTELVKTKSDDITDSTNDQNSNNK